MATARRLGAVVEAFGIRPAVRQEGQSLRATFVGVELDEATTAEGGYAKSIQELTRRVQSLRLEPLAQHHFVAQ